MAARMVRCSRSSRMSNGTSTRRRTAGLASSSVILSLAMCRHSCRHFTTLRLGSPVPRQEVVQPVDIVIVDPGQHVGEPSLRIDIVELGRLNECQHDRGALTAAIGACEQPGLPPESNPAQLTFGGIVAQADEAVV